MGGTMTPVIANLGVYGATYMSGPCLSFDSSLDRLFIGDKCGAYGYPGGNCNIKWHKWQREGWIQALIEAQQEIESDIGAPLCPREICDETHPLRSEIKLRQAPVAYLGTKVWGDWTEAELIEGADGWYIDICESELGVGVTPEYIQFAWTDDVLACYDGVQSLQSPCVASLDGTCGVGEDGYRFTWEHCQLVLPTVDQPDPNEPDEFITAVKWRTYTLDASTAYEIVGDCNCTACSTAESSITVTLIDEIEGIVCVEGAGVCKGRKPRRIRFNYATAADCYGPNEYILGAVVLLALANIGNTPGKPCGCDNRYIDYMVGIDPTAQTEFARKLAYGPTVAGMMVMRRVEKYKTRRNFNERVTTGGFLSSSALRSVR